MKLLKQTVLYGMKWKISEFWCNEYLYDGFQVSVRWYVANGEFILQTGFHPCVEFGWLQFPLSQGFRWNRMITLYRSQGSNPVTFENLARSLKIWGRLAIRGSLSFVTSDLPHNWCNTSQSKSSYRLKSSTKWSRNGLGRPSFVGFVQSKLEEPQAGTSCTSVQPRCLTLKFEDFLAEVYFLKQVYQILAPFRDQGLSLVLDTWSDNSLHWQEIMRCELE